MARRVIRGFEVDTDLLYDFDHHIWVRELGDGRVRIGMDPLGVETSGTLAHLSMVPAGTQVRRGEPFGTLEAEKYVGPLVAPLSGRVTDVNDEAVSHPVRVSSDPFGGGWMIELEPTCLDEERHLLVGGEEEVVSRFADRIAEYRREGVLAE